ncbi:hypothetical protein PsorP6_008623 [Peronosclerospora sorghi]|uniref:Uncharacterized protein n=1 Tax=Peronosclerospora sorghi TaxID=230839 RepID=A0ACC0W8J6_9STRA|nr:hypothetical protein PsorP6_008623 [Peronosclerospora sorghi]
MSVPPQIHIPTFEDLYKNGGDGYDVTEQAHVQLREEVVTHPLVLLSIVDHYNRVARDTIKRVVGVLLGSTFQGKCDITNSSRCHLMKIYGILAFVLGICDVRPNVEGLPTIAYGSIEEVEEDGKAIKRVFKHIKSSIRAYEAEEVGVENLLRDVNDPSVSYLSGQVKHKMTALNGLRERLEEMKTYLENVVAGRFRPNHLIICNMQTIFNLLPNLNVDELVRSMFVKKNDMHFLIYLSSLIRCTIALHNLVNNKIKYKESEDVGFTERKDVAVTDKALKDKTSEKIP